MLRTLYGRSIALCVSRNRFYCSATIVKNDPEREKFVIDLGKNNEAYLEYVQDRKSNIISLKHTFVPEEAKGQGVGKKLAEAAFQYAIENKLMMKLECDFTVKHFKANESKYQAYVTN